MGLQVSPRTLLFFFSSKNSTFNSLLVISFIKLGTTYFAYKRYRVENSLTLLEILLEK
uniref:Uncharacterized protein n=1 Tax=Helianthus annuus TaxID=4232 RepID=A0A251SA68_HELAN